MFIFSTYKLQMLVILSITLLDAKGQDIHFSQFDLTTINLYPALTGIFDGM